MPFGLREKIKTSFFSSCCNRHPIGFRSFSVYRENFQTYCVTSIENCHVFFRSWMDAFEHVPFKDIYEAFYNMTNVKKKVDFFSLFVANWKVIDSLYFYEFEKVWNAPL